MYIDKLKIFFYYIKLSFQRSCCGVDSKSGEFANSGWFRLTGGKSEFPPACCPPKRNGKLMPVCPTISRYGQVIFLFLNKKNNYCVFVFFKGCYEKIKESLQQLTNHFKLVMWTALVISLVQVKGI